jgi:ABC-type dipeptide/oligopeptide/nickel transport system permease component
LVLSNRSIPAVIPTPGLTEYPSVLMAEKNGRIRYYQKGEAVKAELNNKAEKQKIKGFITRISADSVEISSFGKSRISQSISIASIISLTQLKRKERKAAGIIAGIIAVAIGILAITSKGTLFDSAWAFAVIGIPALAAGYGLLLYVLGTYVVQWLNKSSIKKRWKFYSGNPKPVAKGFLFRLYR